MKKNPLWIADEYHTVSRNSRLMQHSNKGVQINYDPVLQDIVKAAPLEIESAVVRDAGGETIELPVAREHASLALEDAIVKRASSPAFTGAELSLAKLAKILYLANGIRQDGQDHESGTYKRNVANAGNLGSVEIFSIIVNVEGVKPGIYHFDSLQHKLIPLKLNDYSEWLRQCVFFQDEFSSAAAILVLTSAVGRLCSKYGVRGYRLALMDIGHVSQNIYLVATALSLNVCATGGFVDCELNSALELDGLDRCVQLVLGVGPR